ncbi:MAG TPA: ArsA-related P-loop ATPase [Acidimicrobiales bacterium]|nr:ArsA-related P-loop ATPase [Acidimicrobiales bacterium]
MSLRELADGRSVIVCCGAGGVGKTTSAAAVALAAASLGRRVCVVTVDPARRLADALGIGEISDLARRVEGPWPGTLDAVMLDPASTFDRLVERYARDREQVRHIFDNRIYKSLISTLSGTQEYMATERLYELVDGGEYDLIVVDTPPSRDALAFLAAPERLASFLDNRLFRLLVAPGKASLRALSAAAQLFIRTIGRIAGREIVEDTMAFFRAFDGMEEGFRERAGAVGKLLRDEGTAYLLVTTPRREALAEAAYLATHFGEAALGVSAVVVNRVTPDFGAPFAAGSGAGDWAELVENLDELVAQHRGERRALDELLGPLEGATVVELPLLSDDVHDLDTLGLLSRLLIGEALP